jgi:hypothetical protein
MSGIADQDWFCLSLIVDRLRSTYPARGVFNSCLIAFFGERSAPKCASVFAGGQSEALFRYPRPNILLSEKFRAYLTSLPATRAQPKGDAPGG